MTNKQGLPEAWVKAAHNDGYDRGRSDLTVTEMIGPPLIRLLRREVDPNTEDVMDRTWSILGQACHTILERAAGGGELVEKRLYLDYDGWTIGGQLDNLDLRNGVLSDYKVTSAWSVIGDVKEEWICQLNMLDYLLTANNHGVSKLQIVAIIRDWSRNRAKGKGYPQHPVVIVDVPRWDLAQQAEYFKDRVLEHQSASILWEGNREHPKECSFRERWEVDPSFALMKAGRKSAVKLFDSEAAAGEALALLDDKHFIAKRPGERRRCSGNYCGVSSICPYYKEATDESE